MREAMVIGGGPAGAALAIRLARAGRDVVVLEREAGPHDKVCGEFLSAGTVAGLGELGIEARALGAVAIGEAVVLRGAAKACSRLLRPALSLSRRVLDEALLQAAAQAGAEVRRGARVRDLLHEAGGWMAQLGEGLEPVRARQAFLATGKHDLRGRRRPPGRQNDFIGFKQHWRLRPDEAAALAGRVELHLFPGGYAGLEAVEGGRANLCLVVRKAAFAGAGRSWAGLLAALGRDCPQLAARLDGAQACTARPLAISEIPYGHVRPPRDGLWRLGDQAAVIPSFTGQGVGLALASAKAAAGAALAGGSAEGFQRRFAGRVRGQVRRAGDIAGALTSPAGQPVAMGLLRVAPALIRGAVAVTS